VVRVGLLTQPEIIAALNKYFVAVEYDSTETGTVPADIPGMWVIKRAWDNSPWTRVSFGSEWVLYPTGESILSTGFHKHTDLPMVQTLEDELEKALTRFARIRSHERGSSEEAAELAAVEAEIDSDLKLMRPCWVDFNLGTLETLRVVATEDPSTFGSRLAGVFTFPEPIVRRQAAEALGLCMATGGRTEFSAEHVLFMQRQMVALLDDPEPDVREAAARAMFQFEGLAVPDQQGDELVASAAALWTEADEALTAAKTAAARAAAH
jgi:hypothetical protein